MSALSGEEVGVNGAAEANPVSFPLHSFCKSNPFPLLGAAPSRAHGNHSSLQRGAEGVLGSCLPRIGALTPGHRFLDTELQNPTALGTKLGKAGPQPFVRTAREVFKPPQLQLCFRCVLHHVTLGTMLRASRWERPGFSSPAARGRLSSAAPAAGAGCGPLSLRPPPTPKSLPGRV